MTLVLPSAITLPLPSAMTITRPFAMTLALPFAVTLALPFAVTLARPFAVTLVLCSAMTLALSVAMTLALPSAITLTAAMTRALPFAMTLALSSAMTMTLPFAMTLAKSGEVWTAPSLALGTHQMVSATGVWRTWSTGGETGQNAQTRRAVTKAVVKAMTRKEHTLVYLQGRWADITLPIRPPEVPVSRERADPTSGRQPHADGRVHCPRLGPEWPRPMEACLHNLAHVEAPPRSLPGARQSVLVLCPSAGPPLAMLEHRPTACEHLIDLGSPGQARTLVDLLGRRSHYFSVGVDIVIAVQQGVLLRNDLRGRLLSAD